MQRAAVQLTPEKPTPLPMSAPEQTFEPAPYRPVTSSTALVPAPVHAQAPAYAAPSQYDSRVQPCNPYPQQQHPHGYAQPRHRPEPGIAALLEVLGGMFAQTFGIGHIYAGNVTAGLLFMFGYWFLCVVNFVLIFFLVGFLTYPLCWILMMVISPITAANSVKRY